MSSHLTPEEFVASIEGTLPPARSGHLDRCGSCLAQVSELRSLLQDVRAAGPVPDPSPLFWDHMSGRIRQATLSAPARESWWSRRWRPMFALTAAAVTMITLLVMRPAAPPTNDTVVADSAAPASAAWPVLDDGTWGMVVDLASDLDWDEAHQATEPRPGTADVLIGELSPAERERLVKLLKTEMGDLE